jgi:hypothetical protein
MIYTSYLVVYFVVQRVNTDMCHGLVLVSMVSSERRLFVFLVSMVSSER